MSVRGILTAAALFAAVLATGLATGGFLSAPAANAPAGPVQTRAGLMSALAAASGGETILLEPGHYGALTLEGLHYPDYVTLRAVTPRTAVFDKIDVFGSSYIAIDGVHVSAPHNGSPTSRIVGIEKDSHHIAFVNSEVNGLVDDDYSGFYAIHTENVAHVRIENNFVHNARIAHWHLFAEDLTVRGNSTNDIEAVAMKFAAVNRAVIENNSGPARVHPKPGDHMDFIQFQGASQNVVLRGNVYLASGTSIETAFLQGIFLDDGAYDDILIENNLIYTGMLRGISVSEGSGIVVRGNTVLNAPNTVHKGTQILVPEGSVNERNVVGFYAGALENNLVLQYVDPNLSYFYNDYYRNPMKGPGLTIEDLTPVAGSLAETWGAADKIGSLLRGEN